MKIVGRTDDGYLRVIASKTRADAAEIEQLTKAYVLDRNHIKRLARRIRIRCARVPKEER